MRIDYPQLEALHAKARRERAQVVYRLLIMPIKLQVSSGSLIDLPVAA